jgi:hypothetical protein
MYVNGKMSTVETITGMGERRIKENDRGGKFNCDVRTFVNIKMYSQQTITN